ncbi:hypothetical protein CHU98_g6755 [Xylaria longipes]|nr:hypothetical protein CHU98_g6755 [Xylaria longipes]
MTSTDKGNNDNNNPSLMLATNRMPLPAMCVVWPAELSQKCSFATNSPSLICGVATSYYYSKILGSSSAASAIHWGVRWDDDTKAGLLVLLATNPCQDRLSLSSTYRGRILRRLNLVHDEAFNAVFHPKAMQLVKYIWSVARKGGLLRCEALAWGSRCAWDGELVKEKLMLGSEGAGGSGRCVEMAREWMEASRGKGKGKGAVHSNDVDVDGDGDGCVARPARRRLDSKPSFAHDAYDDHDDDDEEDGVAAAKYMANNKVGPASRGSISVPVSVSVPVQASASAAVDWAVLDTLYTSCTSLPRSSSSSSSESLSSSSSSSSGGEERGATMFLQNLASTDRRTRSLPYATSSPSANHVHSSIDIGSSSKNIDGREMKSTPTETKAKASATKKADVDNVRIPQHHQHRHLTRGLAASRHAS